MATSFTKKIFLIMLCLASIVQGMYSTYFVSILTTIERIYQIPSKTAGAILSATEVGQILGALLIAHYGGKGNKPRWLAYCMTLTAIAALISTTPHFFMGTSQNNPNSNSPFKISNDLNNQNDRIDQDASSSKLTTFKLKLPEKEHLCRQSSNISAHAASSSTFNLTEIHKSFNNDLTSNSCNPAPQKEKVLVIFFICLLIIGFCATAINTIGISFVDEIVSKDESPLYLGLTIGLKILGPAMGFLLGSLCIRLDVNFLNLSQSSNHIITSMKYLNQHDPNIGPEVGAWWLGIIIISIPLLLLALCMYLLSQVDTDTDKTSNGFNGITYQAAEDYDIGGSTDFQPHILTIDDLDVTFHRTYYSQIDSSSREVLQGKPISQLHYNFNKNISLNQPIITTKSILNKSKDHDDETWQASSVIVNHFGGLESTSFINDESRSFHSRCESSTATKQSLTTTNLSSSLSRLIKNKLLVLRILSSILHIFPVAGFYTFLPKYLIEQFRIAPSSASAISGLAGIVVVGCGAFIGGTVIKLLNVNSKLMTRWIASSALLYAIGMLILMNLGCPQNKTVDHNPLSNPKLMDCLPNCNCSGDIYNPVCSSKKTFLSPCLAGCKGYTVVEDKIIYEECGCSDSKTNESYVNLNIATQGYCIIDCDNLNLYIVLFSIFTLIHGSSEVGSMMFNLRCVKSNDRTLALGLITFTSSLLGTIPCSILYGSMVDLTCVHWDKLGHQGDPSAGNVVGACRAYENDRFRIYLHGVTAIVMFFAFLIDVIICKKAKDVDFYEARTAIIDKKDGLEKSTETI